MSFFIYFFTNHLPNLSKSQVFSLLCNAFFKPARKSLYWWTTVLLRCSPFLVVFNIAGGFCFIWHICFNVQNEQVLKRMIWHVCMCAERLTDPSALGTGVLCSGMCVCRCCNSRRCLVHKLNYFVVCHVTALQLNWRKLSKYLLKQKNKKQANKKKHVTRKTMYGTLAFDPTNLSSKVLCQTASCVWPLFFVFFCYLCFSRNEQPFLISSSIPMICLVLHRSWPLASLTEALSHSLMLLFAMQSLAPCMSMVP